MASRNQNWPPRSLSTIQKIGGGAEEIPSHNGRARVPLDVLNNNVSSGGSSDGSEGSIVVFTVEKKKIEDILVDLMKQLQQSINTFAEKVEKLFESAVKIHIDTENEKNAKIDELNEAISNLEGKIAMEESDKLEATECYSKEKEARIAAEQKAIVIEDLYKRSHEYNIGLQQYNSLLQSNLETVNEAHKRLDTEKSSIGENLSNVTGHNKVLQEQLASLRASQDEATKGKDTKRGYKGEIHVS